MLVNLVHPLLVLHPGEPGVHFPGAPDPIAPGEGAPGANDGSDLRIFEGHACCAVGVVDSDES